MVEATEESVNNVAVGVNYVVRSVDMFISPFDKEVSCSSSRSFPVEKHRNSTCDGLRILGARPDLNVSESHDSDSTQVNTTDCATPMRPKRKKKEKGLEKKNTKYDMNNVPPVSRNVEFLKPYRKDPFRQDENVNCGLPNSHRCDTDNTTAFLDNNTVVWIPKSRGEWEDCVSELTAVCAAASFRRQAADRSSTSKPFYAPLSNEYIRDRVDIDDPLKGVQFRHRQGGWLQGFILWTTFTTWTHYFKWDSTHPKSGIRNGTSAAILERKVDWKGVLSAELESQPREGDPTGAGVVWNTVAEISLLGGLRCGEYLLRMAIEEILEAKNYKYIVLQATDLSRTFYEKFGFVRVGALSKYGSTGDNGEVRKVQVDTFEKGDLNPKGNELSKAEIVGYRHWTYPNETVSRLSKHGGPSYMMALKLEGCDEPIRGKKILDALENYTVNEKPVILPVGHQISQLSGKKRKKRSSSQVLVSGRCRNNAGNEEPPNETDNRLVEHKKELTFSPRRPTARADTTPTPRRTIRSPGPSSKRSRLPGTGVETNALVNLMIPPSPGKNLTYAQKQYHGPWLAVSPVAPATGPRRPPKLRTPVTPNIPQTTQSPARSSRGSAPTPNRKPPQKVKLDQDKATILDLKHIVLKKQDTSHVVRNDSKKALFYNKVVKKRQGRGRAPLTTYFFVFHYDRGNEVLRLIPLVEGGTFTGKREGRTKWKIDVSIGEDEINTVPSSHYEIVPHNAVTKSSSLVQESWDILV